MKRDYIVANFHTAFGYDKQKRFPAGTTIREMTDGRLDYVVSRDGDYILQEFWDEPMPAGSVFKLQRILKEPISTAGWIFLGILTLTAGAYAGSAIQQSIDSWNRKFKDQGRRSFERATASPTYNRRFGFNTRRDGEAVRELFGTVRVFPDLVAEPYFSFETRELMAGEEHYSPTETRYVDEEFAHVLSVVSVGTAHIETDSASNAIYRLGSVLSSDLTDVFEGVSTQHPLAAGFARQYNTQIFPVRDFDAAELRFEGPQPSSQRYNNTPNFVPNEDQWTGPYVLNPSGAENRAAQMYLDFRAQNGLWWQDSQGTRYKHPVPIYAQIREIDDEGAAVAGQDWMDIAPVDRHFNYRFGVDPDEKTDVVSDDGDGNSGTFPAGGYLMNPHADDVTRTKSRSVQYQLPRNARWQVRVRIGRYDSDAVQGVPVLYGIRGQLLGAPGYRTGITYIAARIKATEEVAQIRDRMNVVATRLLPDFDTTGAIGVPEPTSDLARAIFYMLTSENWFNLPITKIDLAELKENQAYWTANKMEFNGVFEKSLDEWDNLRALCQVGRAIPIQQNGKIRIVRDKKQTDPVAVFSNHNIVRNSLVSKYTFPGSSDYDGTEGTFLNRDTWTEETVGWKENTADGSNIFSQSINPERIDLLGITDRAQALSIVKWTDRKRVYRDHVVIFDTEMEGGVHRVGSLVSVNHDVISVDHFNTIATEVNSNTVTLHRKVPANISAPVLARFRGRDGTPSGLIPVTVSADRTGISLTGFTRDANKSVKDEYDTLSRTIAGKTEEIVITYAGSFTPTEILIGEADGIEEDLILTSVSPRDEYRAKLETISDHDRIHEQ